MRPTQHSNILILYRSAILRAACLFSRRYVEAAWNDSRRDTLGQADVRPLTLPGCSPQVKIGSLSIRTTCTDKKNVVVREARGPRR